MKVCDHSTLSDATENRTDSGSKSWNVQIPAQKVMLPGDLRMPEQAEGLVLFAHGSGSSRHSPRNQAVARSLRKRGIGTLLFDLLTADEEAEDAVTGHLRFDIGLLTQRLVAATHWMGNHPLGRRFNLGYFGASTGGAAALVAAASLGLQIKAVVARGSRTDLVGDKLKFVHSPTLLIVGECDTSVLELNRQSYALLKCEKEMAVIPDATHLFEEPGALDEVAKLAADWFCRHLAPPKEH
ncbi:MAG: alpha/beta hydrolase [Verrucomicrobiales bacterium]|nr:alpha/beta hydrolase [Verrucomicrobiales bacterium]